MIILSWNRTDDVLAAVESALEQNRVTRCIQIVDQGSELKNIEKLNQFVRGKPEIALKRLAKNSGIAGGRNIATAMGCGRYVVALDSDAVFADPGALVRAVAPLDSHPELAIFSTAIRNSEPSGSDRELLYREE